MVDIALSIKVSRTLLGLPDLELNDHTAYYAASEQFFGANEGWNHDRVTSRWLDGAVVTSRQRQMVQEPLAIECLGDTSAEVEANILAMLHAVSQSDYTITVTLNGQVHIYQCEPADRTVARSTARLYNNQWQIVLNIPRQPSPLSGGF